MSARVETTERFESVFVDRFDDDVWLSISQERASANVTLTREQAQELVAALNKILGAL